MLQGRKWQKALVFCGRKAWQADKRRRKTLEQAQLSSSDPSSHLSLYICFEIHHYSFAVRCIKTAGARNENKSIKTHVAKLNCAGPAWTKAFSSSHCNSEVKPPIWKIKNRKVTILFSHPTRIHLLQRSIRLSGGSICNFLYRRTSKPDKRCWRRWRRGLDTRTVRQNSDIHTQFALLMKVP